MRVREDAYGGDLPGAGVMHGSASMLLSEAPAGCVSRIPMGGNSLQAGARYFSRGTRVLYDQPLAVAYETHAINRRPQTSFKQRWRRNLGQIRSYIARIRTVACTITATSKLTTVAKSNSVIFPFLFAQ